MDITFRPFAGKDTEAYMTRARTLLILPLAGAMALSACTETGGLNNPDNPNRNSQQGALLGALGGAVAGRAIGGNNDDRVKNAAAGALVGAAAGAVIGNRLDRQEAELRQQLGSNTSIRNTGDRLIVTMPQDILFATDSAELRPTLQGDLREVGQSLLSYPNTTVQVVGHTDNTGSAAYNQTLSERRARAVSSVLLSEGVSASRIAVIGRGEDAPVASNLTPEGRAQNRRVEIVILPNQQ
ncbi:membrane protein [Allosediminivita pacifica]|nr:membrane protein [Allosediminivita pacifica]